MAQAAIAEGLSEDLGRRLQPTFGYYRQRNGWITTSPITRLERVKYAERGWKHLAEYGAFDMSPYVANHPFEMLFMFGGAKEMPVDQIIQNGFHLNPPQVPTCKRHMTQYHRRHVPACWQDAAPVVFPQMADVSQESLRPYPCEFCNRILPTPQGRDQHQQVAHKDEIASLRSGRSLALALNEKQRNIEVLANPSSSELESKAAQDALVNGIVESANLKLENSQLLARVVKLEEEGLERFAALEKELKELREKDTARARMAKARAGRRKGGVDPAPVLQQ